MTDRLKTLGLAAAATVLLFDLSACDRGEPTIENQPNEPVIEPSAPGEEVAPQEPAAAPVYYGVWAADEDDCDVPPASAVPSPIAFAEGEFIGYENRCRIGDAQEGTDGGFQLSLVCMAEGVETVETLDVDVDGEMMRLKWKNGGEAVFVRCKEQD